MAFATDRDLLVLEPRLFVDLHWAGQTLVESSVGTSGTVMVGVAVDYAAAGIGAGHVMTVGGASYEIIDRLGSSQLSVSLLRPSADAEAIAPGGSAGVSGTGRVTSFAPQLELVHGQILRMSGLESDASVLNDPELVLVEALGTLHLIYAAAAAGSGHDSMHARSEMYRKRFSAERARVRLAIDLDGDGMRDGTRRLNASVFRRA